MTGLFASAIEEAEHEEVDGGGFEVKLKWWSGVGISRQRIWESVDDDFWKVFLISSLSFLFIFLIYFWVDKSMFERCIQHPKLAEVYSFLGMIYAQIFHFFVKKEKEKPMIYS